MTGTDEEPGLDRRRVRPYAMTGGRTRPTHDDLEIEALVSTTSVGERTPKLTVEQRAIAALCHDLLSIAEVSARLHLPLGVIRVLVDDMPMSTWSSSTGPPTAVTVPIWRCWSESSTACRPAESARAARPRVGEAATGTSSYGPLPALRPSRPGGGSCRPG
jgi:hypothetical protein